MNDGIRLGCAEAGELAAAYVLGALDAPTAAAVRGHLASCPNPHPEFAELGGLVPYLAEAVTQVEPPARLRDRILAAAAAETGEATSARTGMTARITAAGVGAAGVGTAEPRSPAPRVARPEDGVAAARGRSTGRVLAAAAAIVILVLAGLVTSFRQEASRAEARADQLQALVRAAAAPGSIPIRLSGTANASGAIGFAVLPASGTGYLAAVGLPTTPSSRTYEAWLISGSHPRPAGTFGINADGLGILAGIASGLADTIAVTEEPAGGSDRPTGPILLEGSPTR